MFLLLFQDLDRFNKSLILELDELTQRIPALQYDSISKIVTFYSNYIEITKEIKTKTETLINIAKLQIAHIKYFEGDLTKVQEIKEIVNVKSLAKLESPVQCEVPIPKSKPHIIPIQNENIDYNQEQDPHGTVMYSYLFGSEAINVKKNSYD